MKTIAVIAILMTVASVYLISTAPSSGLDAEFTGFMNEYGRSYSTEAELEFRRQVFAENLKKYEVYQAENPLAEFGVTIFSDRTVAEMEKMMGLIESAPVLGDVEQHLEEAFPNGDIDWRSHLEPVQNQGSCGSCWAFSATASFESRYKIAGHALTKFSEQELVDCVPNCSGCNGGWMDYAFSYLKTHKLCTLQSYRYTAKDGTCRASTCGGITIDKSYVMVGHTESNHMSALAAGPISIAVDAGSWSGYKGGVLTSCGTSINHGVVLAGYNSKTNSWLVRNSWGSSWGESGYIRLAHGKNLCNLTYRSSYPTF